MAQTGYTVTPIPINPAIYNLLVNRVINNSGQVAGLETGYPSGFAIWTPGAGIQNISLPYPCSSIMQIPPGPPITLALNNAKQVALSDLTDACASTSSGGMTDLTPLLTLSPFNSSLAKDVNNNGHVIGMAGYSLSYACPPPNKSTCILYDGFEYNVNNSTVTARMPLFSAYAADAVLTGPLGVNDNDMIVGRAHVPAGSGQPGNPSNPIHAVTCQSPCSSILKDLGVGYPTGINNLGDVVLIVPGGNAWTFSALFCPNQGSCTVLGSLPVGGGGDTRAWGGPNDRGEVVGASGIASATPAPGQVHAFLWRPGLAGAAGTMYDLNNFISAGMTLSSAYAIDNAGQIVACCSGNTAYPYVLLTPAPTSASVPNATGTPGQVVTLTADVYAGSAPVSGGTVAFTVLGTTIAGIGVQNGQASTPFTVPAGTAPGSYPIQAVYTPAEPGVAASSGTGDLIVQAPTTTTVPNVTVTYSSTAQPVTLRAQVTSTAGVVNSGTVTFTLPGATISGIAVQNGQASTPFSLAGGTLPGSYPIQANYTPASGSEFAPSSGAGKLTINPAPTTTAVGNVTVTYSMSSQPVAFTAQVGSTAGVVNNGTVTFSCAVCQTATGSVTGGRVSAVGSVQGPAGIYGISATYTPPPSGSGFAPSSGTGQLTISPAPTNTSVLPVQVTYSMASQPVTLTANVASIAGTVTGGTVAFSCAGQTVAGSLVIDGQAKALCSLPPAAPAGVYQILATYTPLPGSGFGPSSGTGTLTINPAPTTTAVQNVTVAYSPASQSVTLTAQVTSAAGIVNGGTVLFTVVPMVAPAVTANVGKTGSATATTTVIAGGSAATYTLVAAYTPPTGSSLAGSGATANFVVAVAVPSIAWPTPANIVYPTPLGAAQLNATANCHGTFTYTPPAGTVLNVGNGQWLKVLFVSSDGNCTAGMSEVQINVLAPAQIAVTPAFSRNNGQIVVTLKISNSGGVAAQNAMLTIAMLNLLPGVPLPQSLGNLAPGATVTASLDFPGTPLLVGAAGTLTVGGAYTGGSFSDTFHTPLP